MSEDNFDEIAGMFAERVSNPLAWFKHSRSLLAAARSTRERAEALVDPWEKSDLEHVATMLYGFCIENLFKAIWTLKKFGTPYGDAWDPIAEFPIELKTHNLGSGPFNFSLISGFTDMAGHGSIFTGRIGSWMDCFGFRISSGRGSSLCCRRISGV